MADRSSSETRRYGFAGDMRFAGDLARRYFLSADWKAAWGLLLLIALLIVGMVYSAQLVNKAQADFTDSLAGRRLGDFYHNTALVIGLFTITAVATAISTWLRQLLEIRWRGQLTRHYLERWLSDRRYHRLDQDGIVENPEQRVQEDVMMAVRSTIALALGFAQSLGLIGTFGVLLWTMAEPLRLNVAGTALVIPALLFWVAIGYALVSSLVTHWSGRAITRYSVLQQRYEADFRLGMTRVRENGEQIAFYRGEATEGQRLSANFADIWVNWGRLIGRTLRLGIVQNLVTQVSSLIPTFLSVPGYFAGRMTLSGLMQLNGAFGAFTTQISWFVFSYQQIAEWRSYLERLHHLQDALDAPMVSGIAHHRGGATIETSDLLLRLPDGRILASAPGIAIAPGDRIVIRGPSGSGKSTLLRAFAGLWHHGSGTISMTDARSMFLPQRTYLPAGSLAETLAYPAQPDRFDAEQLAGALRDARLPDLAPRLQEMADWAHILSPGEQQRLSAARILLHKPAFLFLDEATSALDPVLEEQFYATIIAALPDTAIVSVAHRPAVAAHHGSAIDFTPGPEGYPSLAVHSLAPAPKDHRHD